MYDNSRMRREIGQRLRQMEEESLTREYIMKTRNVLMMFLVFSETRGVKSVGKINRELVQGFLDQFKQKSAAYQRFVWAVLRGFLICFENPTVLGLKVRIRGSARTRVRWLTPEETEQVFCTPMNPRQRVIIGLELLMALRRIEVLRLTIRDVLDGLARGEIRVQGKGHKERSVPIHKDMVPVLTEYLTSLDQDEKALLFGIGLSTSNRELEEFSEVFGKRISHHDLRRTCGRNWFLAGANITVISELMGHSSIDMTRLYLGLNVSDMRKVMEMVRIPENCTFAKTPVLR
jgi:integrase